MARENAQQSLRVSWVEIERMTAAAAVIREIGDLAGDSLNVVDEVMAGQATIADWRHYPEEDVFDPTSHAQYFYHTHPPRRPASREHGHFHIFLRAEGMPVGAAPLLFPELAVAAAPPPPQAPLQGRIIAAVALASMKEKKRAMDYVKGLLQTGIQDPDVVAAALSLGFRRVDHPKKRPTYE